MMESKNIVIGATLGVILAIVAVTMIPYSLNDTISPTSAGPQKGEGFLQDTAEPPSRESSKQASQNISSINALEFPTLILPMVMAVVISSAVFLGLKIRQK